MPLEGEIPALYLGLDQAFPTDPTQACPHGLPQCACVHRLGGSRTPQDWRRRQRSGRKSQHYQAHSKPDQTQPKELVSSSPRPGDPREGGDRGGTVTYRGRRLLEGREGRARAGP